MRTKAVCALERAIAKEIERLNRTTKEQFVYENEDCINDCDLANKKIKDLAFLV